MHKFMRPFLGLLGLSLATGALADDVTIPLSNGLMAQGSLELADGKSISDGPLVLFVHGTLAHKDMAIVKAQRELLNERDISVLAINLSLGLDKRIGMYDCAVPHTHKHRDALDEIAAWLDWLKEKGATSVVLMGHSRGGNQVAWFGAEQPNDLIDKFILVAPQTWSAKKEVASYHARYQKDLPMVLEKMLKAEGNEVKEGVDFIYCPGAKVTAASFVDYYKPDARMNTPSLLNKISKPTLVVAASEDTVVADLPQQMEKLDLSHVTYRMIEDADHMFIDFAGEDLADQVAEFILEE
ncbi:alpha/beta fold hydrolase [Terasakiella sp. A23]|uniref:alpha/beta hydrolase n=1 Tax=Terasakiella sp. FCG-A23 TaxID=3080561 RepID=UPI002954D388|nr:alpha/beta fold hydrolase [Terasakiella sp. A23]MDV7340915.1 alpha/beta fold hydrolase [Terasakiella sp. A23]